MGTFFVRNTVLIRWWRHSANFVQLLSRVTSGYFSVSPIKEIEQMVLCLRNLSGLQASANLIVNKFHLFYMHDKEYIK